MTQCYKTVTTWGYKGEQHPSAISPLKLLHRPDTTDEKAIEEVLTKNVYQKKKIRFLIEPGDFWLDLGANIGTFSLHVLSNGGKVIAVEPEHDNLEILKHNLENNFNDISTYKILPYCVSTYTGHTKFYLCNGDYNKYRHSMHLQKNREWIKMRVLDIHRILDKYPDIDCIKMDIEGEEINLLENMKASYLRKLKKLVFEYSFDVDRSIRRFLTIIDRLKNIFETVHYTGINPNETEYNHYPPCVIVFCLTSHIHSPMPQYELSMIK